MAWLQWYRSHTWSIFHSMCFMAGSTVFASVRCSVGWIRLFCKIVILLFTWYPLKKDHHPNGNIFPSVCSIVLVGALLPKSVCSLCPPWAPWLRSSQRRVKILITLHTTRLGHKESVSRLNLTWWRRCEEIWFTRNPRYLMFELRGPSFLKIASCHSAFGNFQFINFHFAMKN